MEARALWTLTWPMLIAQLAQMGTGVVDTIMAGRYSVVDLAAVAIGYNVWLPVYLFILGMMLATTAIVAQDFGAGRIERIKELLPQSLWLALILGLIAGPICFFSDPLLSILKLDEQTHMKSLAYLQATAFGMPAAALFQSLRCHTQGLGIMRPFAIASVIGFFANIPLNYALIYGVWGAPELGAEGCGWATAASMWLGPILIAFYMARADKLKPYLPPLQYIRPQLARLREIIRLGLPIGLTYFLEVAVFSIIGLFIATLGNIAMASHQIALNVWDVIYMPLISIGAAMATRIGHAIGAGDREAVTLSVRCGTAITIVSGIVIMLLLLASPGSIVRAYTEDASIFAMAVVLVRLAAFFMVLDAVQVAASSTLRAYKETRFPFLVMVISYWLIALPLGYWLGIVRAQSPTEGTVGFWYAMIAGIAVASVLVVWRQRQLLRATSSKH
ncbi:MAG: MATE family efflux transporter [Proteobacteria bacterium]|nr:MATE family efflux transporter [Pseudomonadota bacterium]